MSGPLALSLAPALMLVMNLPIANRRGVTFVLLSMGLAQAALHLILMAAVMGDGCHITGGVQSHTPGGVNPVTGVSDFCQTAMTGHTMADLLPTSAMFIAHALATALMVLLLAKGEDAVWALVGALSFRGILARIPYMLPTAAPEPILTRERLLPNVDVSRCLVRRRGPPRTASVQ
ncbi:hypothetical protein LWF15_11385 [Kineosporia rhizophila]|uniref:hypothetical protein n=1 Tax=Kineosporia rhizophila TaxID=84633 RepID=UPI001E4026D8|nr:hypothetical protein [Kineosporia rhizophila]MCE0536113.1 hypothetical protein [Kineosporia rhizophila]